MTTTKATHRCHGWSVLCVVIVLLRRPVETPSVIDVIDIKHYICMVLRTSTELGCCRYLWLLWSNETFFWWSSSISFVFSDKKKNCHFHRMSTRAPIWGGKGGTCPPWKMSKILKNCLLWSVSTYLFKQNLKMYFYILWKSIICLWKVGLFNLANWVISYK